MTSVLRDNAVISYEKVKVGNLGAYRCYGMALYFKLLLHLLNKLHKKSIVS